MEEGAVVGGGVEWGGVGVAVGVAVVEGGRVAVVG